MFQIVYVANLRQYSCREQRQWVCLQNDMKDHVGPSNLVVSSVVGGECILEMCQQLQLNCHVRIWDFPIPRRRNSFSLDIFSNSLSFVCLGSKLTCLVTHPEMFQHKFLNEVIGSSPRSDFSG